MHDPWFTAADCANVHSKGTQRFTDYFNENILIMHTVLELDIFCQ